MHVSALSVVLLATSSLLAQSVVVPNANATANGTSGLNTVVRNSGAPRTYMLGINAVQLAAMPVGDSIVGVSFRQWSGGTSTWPASNVGWNDYEISIGASIPPAQYTATFATNFLVPPTLARDGAMLLPAATYTHGAAPNAWGEFYFNLQTPVPYTGGDLGILMTHPGSNDTTNCFLGVVNSDAAAHGVAFSATSFQATTGVAATFYVTRVHYGYGSGCPGTGGFSPVLVQNGDVPGAVGGSIRLAVTNVPANAPALMVVGFGRASIPISPTCNLLVNPLVTNFFLCDPNGIGVQTIAVPPMTAFGFNAQALVLDAGAAGGFTMSNGVSPAVL